MTKPAHQATAPLGRGVRLPAGVRDFLPRATSRRRAIVERLVGEFERWGYQRIITPLYECADVLERGLGETARLGAVRFVEPSGDVVALRPDFTPQVARLAATRLRDVGGPVRLCYEGAVTRIGRGARSQREILQAGVELIGAAAPTGDGEVIALAVAALAGTGVTDARLEVGHVGLASWALAQAPAARRAELIERLSRRDRRGAERVAAGLPARLIEVFSALPELYGPPRRVLGRARALAVPAAVSASFDEVEQTLAAVAEAVPRALAAGLTIDLGEVRGADYYTGVRFAGYLAGVGEAVLRGGRYDQLVGRYGRAARATGFAVDVELVAEAQRAAGHELPIADHGVLILAEPARRRDAIRVATALRSSGHRVAVELAGLGPRRDRAAYAAAVGLGSLLELADGGGASIDAASVPAAVVRRAAAGDPAGLIELMRRP